MRRVALLTNFVSPYRVPVLRRIAESCGLTVFVNGLSEFDRQWNTKADGLDVRLTKTWTRKRTLHHTEPVAFEEVVSQHIPIGLLVDLVRHRPDVIISGELGPRSIVAMLFGRLFRTPVILWTYHSHASSAGTGGKRLAVWRWLLKRCHAVVGMGTQAHEVLLGLGVPEEKIFDGWNAPDVATLQARLAAPDSASHAEALRSRYGDGRKIAVVLGRLVPLKGIPELLAAWAKLPGAVKDQWRLVFVGNGPYESMVQECTDESVVAVGPVSPEEVPDWFRAADLHVFASLGDVWGLVVNEALLCSTPTLCSSLAGCSDDLIVDGENGLLFQPGDPDQCAAGLLRALEHPDLPALGRAGKASAERCTVEGFAAGFLNAIAFVDGDEPSSEPETARDSTPGANPTEPSAPMPKDPLPATETSTTQQRKAS